MSKTLTPAIYNTLILTNGVFSLFRADEPTDLMFAIEHFPSRELVDTFTDETEATDFYHECCTSEREGKSPEGEESRPFSFTLGGMLAVAGMPLASVAVAQKPKAEQNAPDAGTCCIECQPEATTPIREPFHIDSEKSANWYLRKQAQIEAEKVRIKAQSEKMLADLDTDASGLKFLYEGELQEFVRAELARKGRKKTLHLVQGSCSFRSVPASVKVSDPNAALTYAKANGLPCIVITERVDAEEYKKLAEGKMLPGMDTTEARESFTVTFGTK